jgi:formiminotetrahydrofolate cyclodeaminase
MSTPDGRFGELTLREFTEALASSAPTPGGGSAAAVAASLAASLAAMVARLSSDRPRYQAFERTHLRVLAAAEAARSRLLQLAEEDAAAFEAYGAARRRMKESPDDASAKELAEAAVRAAEVPLEVVRQCHALVHEIESLAGRSNLNAASDLDVGALLALAAARGAAANVHINVPAIDDQRITGAMLGEVERRLHDIESAVAQVHGQVRSGNLRGPESS